MNTLDLLKTALLKASALLTSLQTSRQASQASPGSTQTPKTPTPPAQTPQPAPASNLTMLEHFCECIKTYEGWGAPGSTINGVHYPHGTPSYRRNNPGNCRYSHVGYATIYGHVGEENGFAVFKDYATGWLYLNNLIKEKVAENPHATIAQFMAVYAPTSDGNNPARYAAFIASHLGVSVDFPMSSIIA